MDQKFLIEAIISGFDGNRDTIKNLIDTKSEKPDNNSKAAFLFNASMTVFQSHYTELAVDMVKLAGEYYAKAKNKEGMWISEGTLGRLSFIMFNDLHRSREYQEKALKLAEELKDSEKIAKTAANIGVLYYCMGEYEESIKNQEKALSIFEHHGYDNEQINCYINLGCVYRELGQYDKAITLYNTAMDFVKNKKSPLKLQLYIDLGICYKKKHDYKTGIKYYNDALKIAISINNNTVAAKCYNNIASEYYSLGEYDKSITYAKKALSLFENQNNRASMLKCSLMIGANYTDSARDKDAIPYYEKALEIAIEQANLFYQGLCYGNLITAYENTNQKKKAEQYTTHKERFLKTINKANRSIGIEYANIDELEAELSSYREYENPMRQSVCCMRISSIYLKSGNPGKALHYMQRAVSIKSGFGDIRGGVECYYEIGNMLRDQGNYVSAISNYRAAGWCLWMHFLEKSSEWYRAWRIILKLARGDLYLQMGRIKKACRFFQKSFRLSQKLGYAAGDAYSLLYFGLVYRKKRNYSEARRHGRMAKILFTQLNIPEGILKTCIFLSTIQEAMGDYSEAISLCNQARTVQETSPGYKISLFHQSEISLSLGKSYLHIGNYRESIKYLEDALHSKKKINDKQGKLLCFKNLGVLYHYTGNWIKAFFHLNLALDVARELKDPVCKSEIYSSLANLYVNIGNSDKAHQYTRKAFSYKRSIQDKRVIAQCYNTLGSVYAIQKEYKKALGFIQKSKKLCKKANDVLDLLKWLATKAFIHQQSGDIDRALIEYQTIIKNENFIQDTHFLKDLYYSYAILLKTKNDVNQAYIYCKKSLDIAERMFSSLIEENRKIGFSSIVIKIYKLMLSLCLSHHKPDEAFHYLELCKSRAFISLLATTRIVTGKGLPDQLDALLEEEKVLLNRFRKLQLHDILDYQVTLLPEDMDVIKNGLQRIYSEIETIDPEYVHKRTGKTINAPQFVKWLHKQDENIVVVEYYVDNQYIYMLINSKCVNKFQLKKEVFMNKYKRSLTNYLKELVVSSPVNRNWQYLGNCFLQPLKKYIRKDDLILVIPFGNLHFLPFPALLLETEPLITTNPVVYCPSATVAHYITENRSQEKQKSISFGIALSKEEESKQLTIEKIKSKQTFEEEARQIARYLDAPHYIGADVTKKFVCTSMNDKDIIHFSCHGIYNPGDPLASGLKLYDGILTAREIMNLNLKATLVTLNACVTGIGFKTEGDELIGLSRAFLSAGVSSLIVTLWYVYSPSAKMFMEKFYYNYLKEKHNKAKSLQKTQIDIMDNNEFRKPYYWAPYILIGDWQ